LRKKQIRKNKVFGRENTSDGKKQTSGGKIFSLQPRVCFFSARDKFLLGNFVFSMDVGLQDFSLSP
jgi:hypothetical protein